jgi:hypothetical protein
MLKPEFLIKNPVKLIHTPTEQTVVTFPQGLQGRATLSPQYQNLQQAMEIIGLDVPTKEQTSKRRVYLKDKNFGIVFYRHYYTEKMDPVIFAWKPLK